MSDWKINVPNPEVLRAGVKHAEEHIEHWNQMDWIGFGTHLPGDQGGCGTTACLAGHILLSQGYDWAELNRTGDISAFALSALGWQQGDNGVWGVEAESFDSLVFCYIRDFSIDSWVEDNVLAYTPERMAAFKARITEVTGIEF